MKKQDCYNLYISYINYKNYINYKLYIKNEWNNLLSKKQRGDFK